MSQSILTRNVYLLIQHDFNTVCNEFNDTNRMVFWLHILLHLCFYRNILAAQKNVHLGLRDLIIALKFWSIYFWMCSFPSRIETLIFLCFLAMKEPLETVNVFSHPFRRMACLPHSCNFKSMTVLHWKNTARNIEDESTNPHPLRWGWWPWRAWAHLWHRVGDISVRGSPTPNLPTRQIIIDPHITLLKRPLNISRAGEPGPAKHSSFHANSLVISPSTIK